MTIPSARTSAERQVPCSFCGAAINEPCRTASGKATANHGNRWAAAYDAGFVPVDQ